MDEMIELPTRRRRLQALLLVAYGLLAALPLQGEGTLTVAMDRRAFDPGRGETVSLSLGVPEPGRVSLALYDLEHRRIKSLLDGASLPAGVRVVVWKGETDGGGKVGSGQAFFPVARLVTASGVNLDWDPASSSGGEAVAMSLLDCSYDKATMKVRYTVPRPARVRLRAGVTDGPLLKTVLEWAPRLAGQFEESWDGRDDSGLLDLVARQDCVLVPSAYALPEGAILTLGPSLESTGLLEPKDPDVKRSVALKQRALQSSAPIDGHYLTAKAVESSPGFRVDFLDPKTNAAGLPIVSRRAALRVTMDEPTIRQMLMDRCEIIVHVDMKRVFEEEQGYNPYAVEFPTDGFAPGEHLLSVSVASLADRISTISRKFVLER